MISLLVFLPVAFLFLAALGIVILLQYRPSIGYAWAIGALAGLLAVAAAIFLHWRLPLQVTMENWRTFQDVSSAPGLRLDVFNWPYVLSLAALAWAFILTDAARLETEARPLNWAAGLALAGLGMLAVMAANPITLIFTWTAVDLVEFFMVMFTPAGRRLSVQTVTVFSVRVVGTLLVLLAMLFARSQAIPFDLTPIPSSLAIFMLLASGLRLGVLPINLPYTREVYTWRGLGGVMRMLGPASSLVVLGRMPEQVLPPEWRGFFLGLSALAALYGAAMWFASDFELNGRPFWFIALAALAVASVTNGNPLAAITWGTVLILSGSVLFFYSARRRTILFIPLLALFSVLGLPFTPAASGWLGVARGSFSLYTLMFLLAIICLALGCLRHTLRARPELYRLERWVHTVYPAGLLILILTEVLISVLAWPGSLSVGVWWASVSAALIAGIGVMLYFTLRTRFSAESLTGRWVSVFSRRIGSGLSGFFRLDWLYGFIAWVYQVIQVVIQLLTAVFEGDGGILWSLVMLALFVSLIWSGGGR